MTAKASPADGIDALLRGVLVGLPYLELAILFGSLVQGKPRHDSDIDIAVLAHRALTVNQKIDLIDLKVVGEPLLGQIPKHGRRLMGSNTAYAQLLSKHLLDHADFMPYRDRILAERGERWIGK